jgi:hypothetical protein
MEQLQAHRRILRPVAACANPSQVAVASMDGRELRGIRRALRGSILALCGPFSGFGLEKGGWLAKRPRASDLSSNEWVVDLLATITRNSTRIDELRYKLSELQKLMDSDVPTRNSTEEPSTPSAGAPKRRSRAASGAKPAKPRRRRRTTEE